MTEENLKPEVAGQASADGMGSLERGIAGEYQLEVRDVIGEAWRRSSGSKGRDCN